MKSTAKRTKTTTHWLITIILLLALAALACSLPGNNGDAGDNGNNEPAATTESGSGGLSGAGNSDNSGDTANDGGSNNSGTNNNADTGDSGQTDNDDTTSGDAGEPPQTLSFSGGLSGGLGVDVAPSEGGASGGALGSVFSSANTDDGSAPTEVTNVNSYRLVVETTYTDANGQATTTTVNAATVVDPPASSYLFTTSSPGVPETSSEIVIIGADSYINSEGGCFSMSGNEMEGMTDAFASFLNPDQFLGGVEQAERVLPDENINGIDSYHYVFDSEMNQEALTGMDELQGDLYIAKDGGYVTRLILNTLLDSGESVSYVLNVSDVNAAITIEPPAGCGSAGGDYPVMEGAQNLITAPGSVIYEVAATLDEGIAFYEAEMAAAGYTLTANNNFGSLATLEFSKDGETVTVNLTPTGDTLAVIIAAAP